VVELPRVEVRRPTGRGTGDPGPNVIERFEPILKHSPGFRSEALSGWGRFPVETCNVYRPEARDELTAVLTSAGETSLLPRGLGRSYGDAALNAEAGVISMLRLNRLLSLDEEAGVLECEAGVSLHDVLEAVMPRGLFLSVVPGTRFVTVGGAIASDIHGKNHHRDGTFSRFVESMTLLTPAGEVVRCSPEEYRDLFWATVGGMGLTGVILTARLRLTRIQTRYMTVDYRRSQDLDATLSAFEVSDPDYRYSVAWIDCVARGAALGRSILMLGGHAPAERVRDAALDARMGLPRLSVPFDAPSWSLNGLTVRAFNELYYRAHRTRSDAVVRADKFFFPLDGIGDWNRMYGRRGFVQYQAVVPPADGVRAIRALLERLSSSGRASFLAVLKKMGPEGDGMLSFPMEGYTLALDIPRRRGLGKLLAALDRIVLEAGGRVYLTKDASLAAGAFRDMYPGLGRFRSVKEALDPDGLFSSSLARRLGVARDSRGLGA